MKVDQELLKMSQGLQIVFQTKKKHLFFVKVKTSSAYGHGRKWGWPLPPPPLPCYDQPWT